MKQRSSKLAWFMLCLCLTLVGSLAHASTVSFGFTTLPLTNGSANDGTVQSYMNGKLAAGQSVSVTGAAGTNSWTGDGHVVGGVAGTLAGSTSQTYIINNNGVLGGAAGSDPSSNDIKMVFNGLTISSISFDLEIFPDGSCPSVSSCGTNDSNLPDFTLLAGTSSNLVQIGSPWFGSTPSPCQHTTATPSPGCEAAPQLGPTYSGTIALNNVSALDFQDWPATIGIDNLSITYNTPHPVPEPSSMMLLVTGFSWLAALRRRKGFGG